MAMLDLLCLGKDLLLFVDFLFFLLLAIMVVGDPSGSTVLINNLDAGHPLHMNPIDSTSTALIPFKVLGLVYFVDAAYVSKKFKSTYDKVDGSSVRSSLLTRDPLLEVKDAYTTVSREESHSGIPEFSNVVDSKLNATSFAGWIIDSGVNQHFIVSTVGMFDVIDISSLNIIVGHPNGTLATKAAKIAIPSGSFLSLQDRDPLLATISHVGNLKLTNNVVLYDVLVVYGYCASFLYVNKLIKDSKMFVGFDEDTCYIHDLKREFVLGTDSESGSLYLFNMDNDKSIGMSNMVMCFNAYKDLWHIRLGHPTNKVLSMLKHDLQLSKSVSVSASETCHRAKQTREPFPLSYHKSKKLGKLVHLDL
ncbi:hypothetical protein Tco_0322529 [Tanacetum coccineum]